MPFTLTMPKLSPTMTEGTIAKWHKKPGEYVEAGDLLFEVATDKATVEYNALDGGWLRKIIVTEDGDASVNQPVAIFTEEKDESIEGYQPTGEAAPAAPQEAKAEVKAPTPTPTAPAMEQTFFAPEQPAQRAPVKGQAEGARVLASPLARRLARDQGLDLASVQGTGPRGRVMSRDLAMASSGPRSGSAKPSIASGTFEEEKLSPMRKAIAQRLQQAKTFIPHFYVTMELDAEPLSTSREQLKAGDVKVTFNDFVIRACALTLRKHPVVNSGFNAQNMTAIRFKTIDISVAVSLEGGLITPIIRHADYKGVAELSSEMKALAGRAREGKLQESEYKGGSFSISNLGMYGVSDFQAIINPPQVANLAVGAIRDVPVVKDGQVVPGKRLSLTLSADHRVVDGAAAAEFLQTLKGYLENPALLLV